MENWSDGKLHGVFAVSQSVSEVQKAAVAGHLITPQGWLMMAICLGAALSVFAGFLMVRKPLQNIRGVSKILSETSRSVDEAAKGITSLSHSLAQASHEQAAALQETSASIEEMSSMVQKNSDNAKESAKQSENSKIIAMNGREIVGQMIQSIGEIRMSNQAILQQIEASNTEIGQIVKLIQEIGSKTRVINDIVFQTKLLSFNASVEAARAGEHGKGFAVVAEEVGNLAQMSGNAAKEISSMLENGIQSVERIVRETQSRVGDLIRQGEQKIESGSEVATQCGQALQEILAQVEEVTRMAQEISTASQEQAQGVHELTQAMNQLDQATQQNSQTSQNAAGSATKLSQQSEELRRAIGDLERVLQGGTNTDSVPPSESRGGNSPLERIQGPRLAA
jgi:methyl-accepting chemotaxis protein